MRSGLAFLIGSFLLPGAAFAQDADGDGALNGADVYPCDPELRAVSFAPAEGDHGLMLFEDRWPAAGDLDFNDLVLGWNYVLRSDANGVRSMHVTFNVLALGGTLHNGLGLQLPVSRSLVASVTRTIEGEAAVALQPSSADENVTIRIMDDLRDLFGSESPVNSINEQATRDGRIIELDIVFNAPAQIATSAAPYDVFMFRSDDAGHEIHAPDFSGTAAMNSALFNTRNDTSREGRWFVDTQGIPFALSFPTSAEYPAEGVRIDQLFPSIITFAASGGTSSQNFYQRPEIEAAFEDAQGPRLLRGEAGDQSCLAVCGPPQPTACGAASCNAMIAANGAQVSLAPAAGQAAVFTACGVAGQRWAVASSVSSGCYDHDAFTPFGVQVLNTFRCSSAFDELAALATDGDMVFSIAPRTSGATARLTIWNVPGDATTTVAPGAPTTIATTTPAQNARVFFEGFAGQRIAYQVRPSAGCFRGSLLAPDGTVAVPAALACGTTFSELIVLQANGQYTLLIDPNSSDVASYTIDLWTVPEDLVVNGGFGRTSIPISTPSQNATFTFDGTAGQRISMITRPSSGCFRQTISAPSGSVVSSSSLRCGSWFTDVITLQETGRYTAVLNPNSSDVPSFTIDLYNVPADPTAQIAIADPARTMAMPAPGSNGSFTFQGVAGQRISVNTSPSSGCFRQIISAADGTVINNSSLRCGSHFVDVTVLPSTGTYTIALDANDADVPTYTLDIFEVPAEPQVNAAIGGGPVSIPLTTPGLNGAVSFSAGAGQRVNITTSRTGGCFRQILRSPSGAQVNSSGLRCGTHTLSNVTLPEDGAHRLEIDPNGSDTATFTVTITSGT